MVKGKVKGEHNDVGSRRWSHIAERVFMELVAKTHKKWNEILLGLNHGSTGGEAFTVPMLIGKLRTIRIHWEKVHHVIKMKGWGYCDITGFTCSSTEETAYKATLLPSEGDWFDKPFPARYEVLTKLFGSEDDEEEDVKELNDEEVAMVIEKKASSSTSQALKQRKSGTASSTSSGTRRNFSTDSDYYTVRQMNLLMQYLHV